MAAGKWKLYDSAVGYSGSTTLDMGSATSWKIASYKSTSNCTVLSKQTYGDLTNELATGSGYTQGGRALEGVSWSNSGVTWTFSATDLSPAWTASGGTIGPLRHFVIYYDATVNGVAKPLLATCLVDTTPTDVSASDGNGLIVTFPTNRILTFSGNQSDT